ncbi:hypothetical protein C7M84_012124 [Penaeus vannamei]|uniref:Uncharacterized protein n=1 Tax=Penaeus vannamei TaxID=6689 RepID=A0A423SZN9_PENVA|nr:hypothetical protein C7M84_012124 [Penaeus vannamei]
MPTPPPLRFHHSATTCSLTPATTLQLSNTAIRSHVFPGLSSPYNLVLEASVRSLTHPLARPSEKCSMSKSLQRGRRDGLYISRPKFAQVLAVAAKFADQVAALNLSYLPKYHFYRPVACSPDCQGWPSCPLKPTPCSVVAGDGRPRGNMCRDDLQPRPAFLMMGSDQYCLKWNNHWANLIRVFNSLLQSETFVDVTLACEGRHLKAHRLVLSACSPYFKELLVAHPDKHPIVILKDVRYSELRTLIEFIYNGEVSVEQHDLADLLCTARELQIKGLADNRLPGAAPSPNPPSSRDLSGLTSHTLTTTTAAPSTTTATSTTAAAPATAPKSSRGRPPADDRPPPLLTVLQPNLPASAASQLPPYRSRPASRETSPVHKRRRLSTGGSDGGSEACEANGERPRPDAPNGHFPTQEQSSRQYTAVAGPSGLRLPEPSRKEDSTNRDSSWDAERATPSISKSSSGGQSTAASGDFKLAHSGEDTDDDRGAMTIQSPEVILEEGEVGAGSSGPPSTVPSPTLCGSGIGSASLTTTGLGGPLPPQVALLHQALAPSYHPLLHYFPPGLLEQHHQQPPGVSPPKDLMHFLDVMKAIPPPRLPLAALGAPSAGSAGLGLPLTGVSGTVATSTTSLSAAREKGGSMTCHICAMILPSHHRLEEHIRIHEEEKPYKCDQCGQRYKYQSAFQRHQEQNHTAKLPGDKPFRCDVCGQCFKYHKSFAKHRSNHDILDRIMKSESEALHKGHPAESYLQKLLINESSKSESETSLTLKEEGLDAQEEGAERPSTSNPTTFKSALLHVENSENGIRKWPASVLICGSQYCYCKHHQCNSWDQHTSWPE